MQRLKKTFIGHSSPGATAAMSCYIDSDVFSETLSSTRPICRLPSYYVLRPYSPKPSAAAVHLSIVQINYRRRPSIGDRCYRSVRYDQCHRYPPPESFDRRRPTYGVLSRFSQSRSRPTKTARVNKRPEHIRTFLPTVYRRPSSVPLRS